MLKFFSKPWVPYVTPFLVTLICSEAGFFLPQWRFQLLISGGVISATMLYIWREHVKDDVSTSAYFTHTLAGAAAGLLLAALWYLSICTGISSPEPLQMAELWSGVRKYIIIILTTGVYTLIYPIVAELFWRSFLLRYFIAPDFKSIPLGTFNLFSFTMVVILGTLPTSNYSTYLFISSLTFTCITLWSKNIYCSIIAHVVANTCIVWMALQMGIAFW
ncbi:CPBP family glutamic-type intramembrane protease [Vibrio sp.]|uniref:CPBP family glutamic-type intramembrane protease n=1 Tax=Vibrio sp. TaxID=678 RepID=UPI003D13DB16